VKDITEDISASQGRMVMGFSVPDSDKCVEKTAVFNEIFGGSPVSRLFTNVRERLQLCYYCASAQNPSLNVMYVRSGINRENVELAREEIMRQLELLKNPDEISDEELNAAKLGIVSTYKSTADSPVRYASWYINRRIAGKHTDIELCREVTEGVSKEDISEIARGIRPTINYFLNGIEG
jgi:predicted Zn-dependent peptidase